MVTIECVIPQKHHRTVMGARGCKVQGITAEFDVQIKFPDRVEHGNYIYIFSPNVYYLER